MPWMAVVENMTAIGHFAAGKAIIRTWSGTCNSYIESHTKRCHFVTSVFSNSICRLLFNENNCPTVLNVVMDSSKPTILIIGTLDTNFPEILFLRTHVLASSDQSCQVKILDTGRNDKNFSASPGIPPDELVSPLSEIAAELQTLHRSDYIDRAIAHCVPVVQAMVRDSEVQGIVAAGGSSGSALAVALMRSACPIGFPKLMVSTVASEDAKPLIEETDVTVMYSVVDIAGLNSIVKHTLSNAAGAIVGMTSAYVLQRKENAATAKTSGKRIAVTAHSGTNLCVQSIRQMLSSTPHDVSEHEIYVFDATGAGGRAMERLIGEGQIDAIVDLSTSDISGEVINGISPAVPRRLEAAMQKGIPIILSVGACDTVRLGPESTVPKKFGDRKLYVHSPTVTFMRTTPEENTAIGQYIANKLKETDDPNKIRVILPIGGISVLDKEGQPFFDPKADTALFESIKAGLDGTRIQVQEHSANINAEDFAQEVCQHLLEVMGISPRDYRLANARRRKWSFHHGPTIDAVRKASLVNIPDA